MIIGAAGAVNFRMQDKPFNEDDTYVSYLPAAHSFEQAIFGISVIYGMKCGFFGGNVLKLTEDMRLLKPTLFPSVPRLYNKIYGSIQDSLSKASDQEIIKTAINTKLTNMKNGEGLTHEVFDEKIFK